jgi:hypothetical protein
MLLARELPGIEIPDLFLPLDIRQAREMIEKAAFLGFAVRSTTPINGLPTDSHAACAT